MPEAALHLASSSPRRRQILADIGLDFTYAGVNLDESRRDGESVEQMAVRLAREKALAASPPLTSLPVLAADTIVVAGDDVFGKPGSKNDALMMLGALSGRTPTGSSPVWPCGCMIGSQTAMSETEVEFREIRP